MDGGPISLLLSGCSVGKGGNGIGTDSHFQKTTRQRYSRRHYRATEYRVFLSSNTPGQVKDDWEGFAFGIQDSAISFQLLGLDWPLRCSDRGCRSNEDGVVY